MADVADVVVIGGGCSGASIAWQLARRGAGRIVLLEKTGIAAGATGRSSAVVRTHYTHEALARMSLAALRTFERFDETVGGDAGFHRVGMLVLLGPDDVDAVAANVEMHRRVGIEAYALTMEQLVELEPRLNPDGIGAIAWEPQSGYADPVLAASAFAEAARREGVDQRIGVTAHALIAGPGGIERIETNMGAIQTRTVVVAAGFRSRELVAPLGYDLPLRPIRHTIAVVQRSPRFGKPHSVISDRGIGAYYRPDGQQLTLIGASAPLDGAEDEDVEVDRTPDSADELRLVSRFCLRFPSEEAAGLRRGYTGVYDCSPDLQPVLGPVPGVDGLHVAAGFSGHGFKLSPITGELVAEHVVDGRTSLVDIGLFSPARFASGQLIVSPHGYSVATHG
jgi:glycine/D-amino acid oxidase-like deaminating enzyme